MKSFINYQSKMQPLLTIAVPTYNRASTLSELLDCLLQEFRVELGGDVEIIISDNASNDETSDVLGRYSEKSGVKIYRQKVNIGPDENFAFCFEKARGNYLWLIGDDDLVVLGSGLVILDYLESEDVDLLYLRPRWMGNPSSAGKVGSANVRIHKISREHLAHKANVMVTFMSSWIINVASYQKLGGVDIRKYSGTSLIQAQWFLMLLCKGRKFGITSSEVILAKAANSGGYDPLLVFDYRFRQLISKELEHEYNLQKILYKALDFGFLPGLVWDLRRGKAGAFDKPTKESIVDLSTKEAKDGIGGVRLSNWVISWLETPHWRLWIRFTAVRIHWRMECARRSLW